jgi:HK97 family phage prohead protease
MRRSALKTRRGGLDYEDLERRVLAGEPGAMRPLVRQGVGVNQLDMPFKEVELRAAPDGTGGTRLLFTGYASCTEQIYQMQDWLGPYSEIVRQGAFAKTLAGKPDTIFCLNHGWDAAPMARTGPGTLRLVEDEVGLAVQADIDGKRADVYTVQSAMDAGELDAMSFAFWVTRQEWSPDYEQRDIFEVDIDGGDTSVVTWPANPTTSGTTALRAAQARALLRSGVPRLIVARAREEKRAGKSLSASTMATLEEVLDLIAASDVGLDAAQPLLAELMGVSNPNDDEETDDDTTQDSDTETDSAKPAGISASRRRLREDPAVRLH